jgi:putative alpha-1,2-mannosidase
MDEVIGTGYEQESISEQVKNKVKEIKDSKVYKDIFSHPITGCYEHQDENGNWVEGPALGHSYHGGYDEYREQHKSKLEKWLEEKGIL